MSRLCAFEHEAQRLDRLRHVALPTVKDHFSEGDGQYLVMEYIDGEDLGKMLKQRKQPFPMADVLAWVDTLLDALTYLHQEGVIHRDIKPANIWRLSQPSVQRVRPYGALEMAGNVWEWVSDTYDSNYYASSPRENPTGPVNFGLKVLRGGSWYDSGLHSRVTYRIKDNAYNRDWFGGFRCA